MAAAVALTAAQQANVQKLASDLLFLLQDAGVVATLQARLGELNVITVALFAGLDEDRTTVRAALAKDLPLDVAASTENRLEMAKLLTAWEPARLQMQAIQRNQAESKLGVQQRVLHPTEHQAMRPSSSGGGSWLLAGQRVSKQTSHSEQAGDDRVKYALR